MNDVILRLLCFFAVVVWRPVTYVWCLVGTTLPHSYPGHAARVSMRICQSVYPVMFSESALARDWRGVLYLYKAPACMGAWKVCRTFAAVIC